MIFPRALLISFRDNIIGIPASRFFLFDFSHATTTTVTPWLQMAVHTIISASESGCCVDETMLFPVDLNKRTPRKLPQSAEKNSVDSFLFYFISHFTEIFLSFFSLRLFSQHILKLAIKPQRVVCCSSYDFLFLSSALRC
jgi:hypothetical protein